MKEPSITDYVELIHTLFDQFTQAQTIPSKRGRPFFYKHKPLLIFFTLMQFLCIRKFKAQHRWLKSHPQYQAMLEFKRIPVRTTLSRRYKALYETLQELVAFLGTAVEDLVVSFRSPHEGKRLRITRNHSEGIHGNSYELAKSTTRSGF